MANRPAMVKQADITRALKGALQAGFEIARVEVKNGSIVIIGRTENSNPEDENSFDEVLD